MKKILLSVLAAALSLPAVADEGMWLLPLLQQQKFPEMQALGLKLQDYDIYSPDSASLKDAVVIFGGGCTGEIVSPDGLLLTNHHCGYGQIQQHSTLEHDYLTDGFWATTREQGITEPRTDRHLHRQDRRCNRLCKERTGERYRPAKHELPFPRNT